MPRCPGSSAPSPTSFASRSASRHGAARRLRERIGRRDDRLVFVVGSPRSGTTFLAGAIGSVPGFVDLGEVAPVKAAIPELVGLPTSDAAGRLRGDPRHRAARRARRLRARRRADAGDGLPRRRRGGRVPAGARRAHRPRRPRRRLLAAREGLAGREPRGAADDAGLAYGVEPRFWVEPERREEFTRVSDARRAAWAWRRYVTAARSAARRRSSSATRRWPTIRRRPPPSSPSTSTLRSSRSRRRSREVHTSSIGRYPHRPHRGAARRRRRRGRRPPDGARLDLP